MTIVRIVQGWAPGILGNPMLALNIVGTFNRQPLSVSNWISSSEKKKFAHSTTPQSAYIPWKTYTYRPTYTYRIKKADIISKSRGSTATIKRPTPQRTAEKGPHRPTVTIEQASGLHSLLCLFLTSLLRPFFAFWTSRFFLSYAKTDHTTHCQD